MEQNILQALEQMEARIIRHVDERFEVLQTQINDLRTEMNRRFDEIEEKQTEVIARHAEMQSRRFEVLKLEVESLQKRVEKHEMILKSLT